MENFSVEIRGHHLLSLFYCFSVKESMGRIYYMAFFREKEYGKRFAENEKNIWLKIYNNPGIKIRLVARKDALCKSCRIECFTTRRADQKFIASFGCEVNGVYYLEELIQKGNALIEDYKKSLPAKKGRPKTKIAVGSQLDCYK